MRDPKDLSERRAKLSPQQTAKLQQRLRGGEVTHRPKANGVQRAPRRDGAPLSFGQQRLWFLWTLDPTSSAYHLAGRLECVGSLDVQAIRDSIQALVMRHESLRTVFAADSDGVVQQLVRASCDVELPLVDVTASDPETAMTRVQQEFHRIRTAPFDLEKGPLLRCVLLKLGVDRCELVVVMHHIVSDAYSTRLILEELTLQYRARVLGHEPRRPDPSMQYVDYAVWQRDWSDSEESRLQLEWWRDRLGAGQPVLLLHTDRPRKPDGAYTAARHRIVLDRALTERLRKRSQSCGGTLFMALLTAFQALLHRYTGQSDIRVGVPIANRNRREFAELVGFLINTQIFRVVIDTRTSLEELLKQVRDMAVGAQANQDLPFDRLVEWLRPERTSAVMPLAAVFFNHLPRNAGMVRDWPGLAVKYFDLDDQATQFELSVQTREDEAGGIEATIIYAEELFERQTIKRMAGHYVAMLCALVEQPGQAVGDVQLLSESERGQLRCWGVNECHYENFEPIHTLIERQVQARALAPAVTFTEQLVTYEELNRRANQLAHRLMRLGVKLETRVGIAIERSIEMVVGLLSILKAGGAYVPLDPEGPRERLGYMMEDSGISVLLTQSHVRERLPIRDGLQVVELNTLDATGEPQNDPCAGVDGENLAYVIYTSGSTGRPKGVMVRHRALSHFMLSMKERPGMSHEDTLLAVTSLSFDISALEIYLPLLSGARIVLASREASRNGEALAALIERNAATVLQCTPASWRLLRTGGWPGASGRRFKGLCGGEALPSGLAEDLSRAGVELWNMYGPTETTIWSSTGAVSESVSLGSAVADTQLHVLGPNLSPVPISVPGELYLGGVGLARGYNARAGLTAERFVADPFDSRRGRLYRTGDLVRWNAAGKLEYLGRIDHQVKIRGFRIELGEVETLLLSQPEVSEAVVVASEVPSGGRLVAYVCASTGHMIDVSVLRVRLSQVLPDYMVPAVIMVLDSLPLNSNGKVDRKALPEPELAHVAAYEAPQGLAEQTLAVIWCEVLGLERVGRHDNFFELGGHSLLALRVLDRMRGRGWKSQVRSLFQRPQLAAFAQTFAQESTSHEPIAPPNRIPANCAAIQPGMLTLLDLEIEQIRRIEAAVVGGAANIQDIYPVTPFQQGMLFHHLMEADGDPYVVTTTLAFDDRTRLARFVDSFNRVIDRHDILRTAVLWEGLPEGVQVVYRQAPVRVQWLDAQDDVLKQLDEYAHPRRFRIDVSRAPMFHLVAVRDSTRDRWLLRILTHHLIVDHQTMQWLTEEIAFVQQGRETELPEPIPFRRFVAQVRFGMDPAEHEAFFRKLLGDVDEPTAPFGVLKAQGDGTDIEEADVSLGKDLARDIRQQAQRHGVSTAALFHLAWALVLSKTTGKDDVVFGTVLLGRMHGQDEVERVLGMFINTLPIRIRLGVRSVEQCLKQTHQVLSELLHHETASLTLAQRCSSLPGGTPLFSALFNYRHGGERPGAAVSAWDGVSVLKSEERTNYPVTLSVDDLGEGFRAVAQALPSIGAKRVGAYLNAVMVELVAALADRSQRSVAQFAVLSDIEQAQLHQWGVSEQRYPSVDPLHRLIERRVQQAPDAVALMFGRQKLSYAELNRRSNQLAHRLIALGVTPEVRVGIAFERSMDVVAGMLAILKAGGAYVPLDPAYPAERLNYMMRDSGIELLLTQSATASSLPVVDGIDVMQIDELCLSMEPEHDPAVSVHPDNLAYVIYTSGSTGKPKGAQLCHRNVTRLLAATHEWFHFNDRDTWTLFHSCAFDFSVWEIFGALCHGGRLVIVPYEVSRSPEEVVQLLRREQVTVLNQTPSAFKQLMQVPAVYTANDLALRAVIFGGEALDPQSLRPWLEHFGDLSPRLINMYGITETTVHVTYRPITKDDLGTSRSPIGERIPDLGIRVLDAHLEPVPIGVPGELYVAGDGVSRGYMNRTGLSSERFIANPASTRGERLYRTGDQVRWNQDGQLEYLGRIDHQVKIRGFRIELGEIESQLLAQPEVREAVVVAKDGPSGPRLVGYVSATTGYSVDIAVLRERISAELPDYMVPSAIAVIEKAPLNANGKVDRKALPEPEYVNAANYEAPQGEIEETLAKIWAAVLKVGRVGRHDNFFELGGDSILNLQIVTRARSAGWKLSPKQLFKHTTVAALARVAAPIDECESDNCASLDRAPLFELSPTRIAALPFSSDEIEDVFPLTPMQEGMLLHTVLDPTSGMYLMQHRYTIESAIDLPTFWASWDIAIQEHAALRAGFFWQTEKKPFQVIQRSVTLPKDYLDLRDLDRATAMSRIDDLLSEELETGFDMSKPPLVRIRLAQLGARRFHLVISYHHILVDAWCFGLLMAEVLAQYEARTSGLQQARERPAHYREFIAWLQRRDRTAALDYWRQVLDGFDLVTPLPMIRHALAGSGGSSMVDINTALSAEQTSQLMLVANRLAITPNTLIQGAWALVLARYANTRDVLFGVTVAGKPAQLPRLEKTLGLFINTIPLRVTLPNPEQRLAVGQWLQTLFHQNTQAREFDHLPLTDIQALSALPHERSLFDSLFVFENAPIEATALESAERLVVTSNGNRVHTNYPITVMIVPAEKYLLQITYDERLLDASPVEQLLSSFRYVVEQLIATPTMALETVRVLTQAQQRAIVTEGIGRNRVQPFEPDYIGLFQRTVAKDPSRIAARCGGLSISYGELDSSSDRMAELLRREGSVRGETVLVFCERNLEFLTMALACFKAGAAYLAVDVGTPPRRLARIVAISGARFILAHSTLPNGASIGALNDSLAVLLDDAREICVIDVSKAQAQTPSKTFRPATMHPDQPAYVIFTSGSTGEPKGVVVTSRGMLNNQLSKIDTFPLGPDDVIAQTASQSFDISVWQLLGGLLCGACVDIVPADVARDPGTLLKHVRSRGITVLECVPSMMSGMLASEIVPLPALRVMMATGEAVDRSIAREWKSRYPDAALINAYGPAECADDVALHVEPAGTQITEIGQGGEHFFPIGRAVDNNHLCVLDSRLEPVPVGVAGELYVAGIGVGQGYLARSDLTSERFVADVFSAREGARMYRTGDVVRSRPDGAFEYLGRTDHQVKVRGYRIELGEIEAQVARFSYVQAAAVGVQEDALGTPRLVGYVVPRESQSAVENGAWQEKVQSHLREVLPEYMVPTLWMSLEALPLTANGKVDRKALPRPDVTQLQASYEPPEGEVEEALAQIWADLLGVERVGRRDNFFELGGHSLLAMRAIAEIRATMSVDAQVSALFKAPTLAQLAELLSEQPAMTEHSLTRIESLIDALEQA